MNTLTTIFAIIGFVFILFCIICFLIGVIDYFKNYPCGFCNCEDCPDNENAIIDIQLKEGHWRAIYQGDEIINYRCSECDFGNTFGKGTYRMNYCPNCGAKMEE